MSNIVEKGFNISNEFDGARLKHTIKKTIVKEWVGKATTNINIVEGGDDSYNTIVVAGESYSTAKITNVSYEFVGDQAIKVTEVEQKISPSSCPKRCNFDQKDIEDFSDSVKVEKGKDSMSYSRDVSIKLSTEASLVSAPASPSGSALIDSLVACAQAAMSDNSNISSLDSEIQTMIDESSEQCGTGIFETSQNETIDKESCSVSLSKTITKNLNKCESNCSKSMSTSISYDDSGLVSINVSGDVKGEKEDFQCDSNGIPVSITKTKLQYAEECYDGIDLESKIVSLYNRHKKEACETDVCLALRLQSKSTTTCLDEGTISFSASASEEEVTDEGGGKEKVKDKESKNGCTTSLTRTFEFSSKVGDPFAPIHTPVYLDGDCTSVLNKQGGGGGAISNFLGRLNTSPPAGFFGPLSMSMNISPTSGSVSGSVNFDNSPANDPSKHGGKGMIKKLTTTTTVCPQEKDEKNVASGCGAGGQPLKKTSIGAPGSTKICKDVEVYPCGTAQDILDAIDIQADGTVVEDSFSISLSDGAKTGSACKKWHTDADLKGGC